MTKTAAQVLNEHPTHPIHGIIAVPRVCLGEQVIAPLSSVTPASLTIPTGAIAAEIQADGGTVRMRADAGVPSATVGRRIDDGMVEHVDTDLTDIRLIAAAGTSTNVQIRYFDKV